MSPETHLAVLIARWMDADDLNTWKGTADELKTALADNSNTQHDSRDLLKWLNAIGTYLGRLSGKARGGLTVESCRSNNARRWLITRAVEKS